MPSNNVASVGAVAVPGSISGRLRIFNFSLNLELEGIVGQSTSIASFCSKNKADLKAESPGPVVTRLKPYGFEFLLQEAALV
jgi:hypothetical protein